MESQTGIYLPLNKEKREIRLLRLQMPEEADLHFTLQEFSLDDCPEFVALSYRWGPKIELGPILINRIPFPPAKSKSVPPRANLRGFFEMIKVEEDASWVFVDAVCINQDDLDEKSSQVQLMGDIYRRADRVLAWMGVIGNERAFSSLVHKAELGTGPIDLLWSTWGSRLQQLCQKGDKEIFSALCSDDSPAENNSREMLRLTFVLVFLNLEYWSRVWILQEVILGRNLMFQFGPIRVSVSVLERLVCAAEVFGGRSELEGNPAVLPSYDPNFGDPEIDAKMRDVDSAHRQADVIFRVRQRHQHLEAQSSSLPFPEAIRESVGQECEITADKVCGILALTRTSILPDYACSNTDLYLHALLEGLLAIKETDWIWSRYRKGEFWTWLQSTLAIQPLHPTLAFLCVEVLIASGYDANKQPFQDYFVVLTIMNRTADSSGSEQSGEIAKLSEREERLRFERSVKKCIRRDALPPVIEHGDTDVRSCSFWRRRISELKKRIIGE